jgi:hypothetical protein
MKLLLDAMMPVDIADHLLGHEIQHAARLGWQHLANGALLTQAEAPEFDVLITKDVSIRFQQNLAARKFALIVVRPQTQDFEELVALAPRILGELSGLEPGQVAIVKS